MTHGEYGGGSDSAFDSSARRHGDRFGPPEHRRFGSTEHLAAEAVAAYVDGELRMGAYMRAAQHIALCPECAAEVEAQQQARGALRRSGEIPMPNSLLGLLSQIPLEFPGCSAGSETDHRFANQSKRWALWRRK